MANGVTQETPVREEQQSTAARAFPRCWVRGQLGRYWTPPLGDSMQTQRSLTAVLFAGGVCLTVLGCTKPRTAPSTPVAITTPASPRTGAKGAALPPYARPRMGSGGCAPSTLQ